MFVLGSTDAQVQFGVQGVMFSLIIISIFSLFLDKGQGKLKENKKDEGRKREHSGKKTIFKFLVLVYPSSVLNSVFSRFKRKILNLRRLFLFLFL